MKKLFSAKGRCGRLEYFLTAFVCNLAISVVNLWSKEFILAAVASIILGIVGVWITVCAGARRCHDLGHNGWWQLIPLYGIWLVFAKGQPESNEYGAPIA